MEQRFHIGMRHKRRFVPAWRWKVTQQSGDRSLIFAVWQKFAADNRKFGEVIELSFAREHIEVKHTERFAGGGIRHHIKLEIVDPFVRRGDFLKLQPEDALVDV